VPSTAIQNAALDLFIALFAPIVNATGARNIRAPFAQFRSHARNAGNPTARVARQRAPENAEPSDVRNWIVSMYL
jgi:hypothetical protein